MTTMQLHMGKLWFAGETNNWDLARYELDELHETMEATENLHSVKNGVDISKVVGRSDRQSSRRNQSRHR